MKRVILIALSLFLVTIMFFGCYKKANEKNSASKESVKIDVNVPQTGPISAWSGQYVNGFSMGIEDACKKYEVNPEIFKIDYQDNGGESKNAVMAYKKQQSDGFDVFISVSTIPVNAFGTQVDKLNKPHFIASFDPFITKESKNRFRLMANSKIEAPLFIDYALKKEASKVYIVQLNLSYAEDEFGKIIQPTLEKNGVKVIRELFDISDREFKNITTKIREEDPDLIFICGYSFHVLPLIRDLRAANLIKENNVVSVMDFVDLLYNGTSVDELRGITFVSPIFDIPGKVSGVEDWRKRYETKYSLKPTYVPAYAYDNATLIVKAYSESGQIDNEAILKALPFQGVNGNIDFDNDNDIISTVCLARINNEGIAEEVK